mmetsp:Transcript_15239/g.32878  ORF Transcript_15239/g.32878 Transcript_15239/m.32878 type:complete len:1056 (+) Transcript_15239:194-3361(+)
MAWSVGGHASRRLGSHARAASVRWLSATSGSEVTTQIEFARSAQNDLQAVLQGHTATPLKRLKRLSEVGLTLWPKELPQWRVALPVVVGKTPSDLSAEIAHLSSLERAACLRTLCRCKGGGASPEAAINMLEVLVKGKKGTRGLAAELSTEELLLCIIELSEASFLPHNLSAAPAPIREFVEKAWHKLAAVELEKPKTRLSTSDLHQLRAAVANLQLEVRGLENVLRRRLQHFGKKKEHGRASPHPVADAVKSGLLIGQLTSLRTEKLREAMLPSNLAPSDAAHLLKEAVPTNGTWTSGHLFAVEMAEHRLRGSMHSLSRSDLITAIQGAHAIQVTQDPRALKVAHSVLKFCWHLIPMQHLNPEEFASVLVAYTWAARSQGPAFLAPKAGSDQLPPREFLLKAFDEKISSLPLECLARCLTALAPGLSGTHDEAERKLVQAAVAKVFPDEEPKDSFREEYLQGEFRDMPTTALLELACGMAEFRIKNPTFMSTLLAQIEEDIKPAAGGQKEPVELTHLLLLRLCRSMEIWQGLSVEDMLTQLLSDPVAMRQLPPNYFAAVLSALSTYNVPKELPLSLVAFFLDRTDAGDVKPATKEWVQILEVVRKVDEPPWWERVTPRVLQTLVPHIQDLDGSDLSRLLAVLGHRPNTTRFGGKTRELSDGLAEQLPDAVTSAVSNALDAGGWDFGKAVRALGNLANLGWYQEQCIAKLLERCASSTLLEPHSPLVTPLVQACNQLQIYHAPLLSKVLEWYVWSCAFLRPNPMQTEQITDLLTFSEQLLELNYHSLQLQDLLAKQLRNPNATAAQKLALLAALARSSHFPVEFKDVCQEICSPISDMNLGALTPKELMNAFNIHLCAIFDGPAALRHWLTTDPIMKDFFQVHTSQRWYQGQDQLRIAFMQSEAYATLKSAIEAEGLDLQPTAAGEVYHIEFASENAKARLSDPAAEPPMALVCIRSKEQLRWYVPVMVDVDTDAATLVEQNRCKEFKYMFRDSVQKIRHLQAMGYRTVVVWLSEWNELESEDARRAYLRMAVGSPSRQNVAFSPSTAVEQEAFE